MTERISNFDGDCVNSYDNSAKNNHEIPRCDTYVRYARNPQEQEPKINHINDSIPNDVCFASPIYYLNPQEIKDQNGLPTGYEVSDKNVAKKLQDIAESQRRVYYPIYVESDAEVPFGEQIQWMKEFCRGYLNVDPYECSWYFSGNRSVHAHVSKLATENNIDTLRERAKDFEHDIDYQVYSRKRQFRLPGATHEKTGLPKVPIEPDWGHDRIIREASESTVSTPETYRDVLLQTFGSNVLERPQTYLWEPTDDREAIEPGLNDWEEHTGVMSWEVLRKYKSHYATPVSPYAKAGNGNRSLLIAKAIDGAYAEKREKCGEWDGEEPQVFVPSDVLKFIGCSRDYTVEAEHRPVKLSKPDYEKFVDRDIEPGDMYAIIGGKSRKSRIFKLSPFEATTVAGSDDFRDNISVLEYFEYDTGESKRIESNYANDYQSERTDDVCQTIEMKHKAETDGIESLPYSELLDMTNGLLQIMGIDGTRTWFKEQYGENYDRELTNNMIQSICKKYDDLPEYERSSSNVTRTSI